MSSPITVLLAEDAEPMRKAVRSLLDAEPTITVVAEATDY
jgi:DNA-binding NarL/FixJ family response regulator